MTEPKAISRGGNRFGILHARNGVWFEQLDITGSAAPEEKLHELGQFFGRSFHVACGTKIDFFVWNGARGITVVALRQLGAVRVVETKIAGVDTYGSKNIQLDVLIKRQPGDFFNQVARNSVAWIRVSKPSARRPADILRFLKTLENVEQRKICPVVPVVNLAGCHVVEACSVFEQIDDAHWVGALPTVFYGNFRRDIMQPRIEVDLAFFLQLQERQRHKAFTDRAHAKFRVTLDIAISRKVRFANSSAPQHLAV